jgi:hypothetical protein
MSFYQLGPLKLAELAEGADERTVSRYCMPLGPVCRVVRKGGRECHVATLGRVVGRDRRQFMQVARGLSLDGVGSVTPAIRCGCLAGQIPNERALGGAHRAVFREELVMVASLCFMAQDERDNCRRFRSRAGRLRNFGRHV